MQGLRASWSPRPTKRGEALYQLKAELCNANLLHGIAECAEEHDTNGTTYHYRMLMKYHAPRYSDRKRLFRQILDDYIKTATQRGSHLRNW